MDETQKAIDHYSDLLWQSESREKVERLKRALSEILFITSKADGDATLQCFRIAHRALAGIDWIGEHDGN